MPALPARGMVESVLYYVAAAAGAAFQVASACHALLNKRDPRSQLGWVVICLVLPMAGALAYWIFGVNRIRTRARRWVQRGRFLDLNQGRSFEAGVVSLATEQPGRADSLLQLLQISNRVTQRPLVPGNQVDPLHDGEQAYPAMIAAIEGARRYIHLSSYIFNPDKAGGRFVDALGRASQRGVDVRVLVDAIGERYHRPRVTSVLRERYPGVRVATFLPLTWSLRTLRANMRNHRKILVVDGDLGFTGGMNIALRHVVGDPDNDQPTTDLHFRVRGPVVFHMNETFMEDWFFETGEASFCANEPVATVGSAMCRAIKDGPNEDFERLQWILIGAMTCARESIRLMTPYFIPGREILAAINTAVLRGVNVEIILPARSNLPFVDWASRALLWEVLQYGARIFLQPAPFNHSKLLIVDDFYVNLGSANIDPRSLRLNFELNLEVYDPDLAADLRVHFEAVRVRSSAVDIQGLDARSFPLKLRDATAKLFSPYL